MVASVTLDVGVNVIANLVHCTAHEVMIGMKVMPCWLPRDREVHRFLPLSNQPILVESQSVGREPDLLLVGIDEGPGDAELHHAPGGRERHVVALADA